MRKMRHLHSRSLDTRTRMTHAYGTAHMSIHYHVGYGLKISLIIHGKLDKIRVEPVTREAIGLKVERACIMVE